MPAFAQIVGDATACPRIVEFAVFIYVPVVDDLGHRRMPERGLDMVAESAEAGREIGEGLWLQYRAVEQQDLVGAESLFDLDDRIRRQRFRQVGSFYLCADIASRRVNFDDPAPITLRIGLRLKL